MDSRVYCELFPREVICAQIASEMPLFRIVLEQRGLNVHACPVVKQTKGKASSRKCNSCLPVLDYMTANRKL